MQPTRDPPHSLIRVFHQVFAEDLPGCAEYARNEPGGSPQAHLLFHGLLLAHREAVLAPGQRSLPRGEFLGSPAEERSLTLRFGQQPSRLGLRNPGGPIPLISLRERRLRPAEPLRDGFQRPLLGMPAGARQAPAARPDPRQAAHCRDFPVNLVLPCPHGSAVGACLAPPVLTPGPSFGLRSAAVMQPVGAELRVAPGHRGEVDVDVRLVDVQPHPEHPAAARLNGRHPASGDPPQPILDLRAVHLRGRPGERVHLGVEGPEIGTDAVACWGARLGSEPVVLRFGLRG